MIYGHSNDELYVNYIDSHQVFYLEYNSHK